MSATGPLAGLRVLEYGGIGPAPFAAMLLGDMGAEVLRIDRAGGQEWPDIPILNRNRSSLALDLKQPRHVAAALALATAADIVIEGFRPGVMERLELGPEQVHARAPGVVYGRMTGWGQTGPLAQRAGHDINYIGLAGPLAAIGRAGEAPTPPLNLLGDYAAGALYLVIGITAALVERARSGRGQVVDAAIVDGAASLMTPILGMAAAGLMTLEPGANLLGGETAPFYRCYRCRDDRFVAVGSLEGRFRALLCETLGLADGALGDLANPADWPEATARLAAIFATRTQAEWEELFAGKDACVSPVLDPDEAPSHPHLADRATFLRIDGVTQPAPAPRFSRTPGEVRWTSPAAAPRGEEIAASWGVALQL